MLAGPTCDSIDVIDDTILLPELEVGDLVVGRMMGAYTWASATDFNFFKRAKVVVMNERPADAQRVVRLQRKAAGGRPKSALTLGEASHRAATLRMQRFPRSFGATPARRSLPRRAVLFDRLCRLK